MLFCPFYNSDIVQTFQLHMHAKIFCTMTFAYMDLQFIAFMDFECSHVFSVFCCVSKHYRLSCFMVWGNASDIKRTNLWVAAYLRDEWWLGESVRPCDRPKCALGEVKASSHYTCRLAKNSAALSLSLSLYTCTDAHTLGLMSSSFYFGIIAINWKRS